MPLPHRINITSGGTGDDPGEMLYGCQVDRIDGPPGSGSRGFSPGEDALSKNFNRSAFALAENDEYLGDIIVKRELAYKEVGALAAFSANNIKIDPSGAALGNVNYTGSLYLGEAGWPASQENLDSLFQLLDENYNEVIVDGVEVKITSIQAPRAVGDEFVATITQLNLNKTVPSANYRIAYGRGTTLENIPPYSLIGADIRGLHEAAGETNRKAFVVCTPAGGTGDFTGVDAVINALAAYSSGDTVIFIRNGSYNIANAGITGIPRGVTLIGEAVSGPGVANGVILLLNGAGGIVVFGADNYVEKIQFRASTPDGSQFLVVFNSNCTLRDVSIDQLKLSVPGDWNTIENVRILPYDVALDADQSNHSKFKNIQVSNPIVGTASELVLFSGNTEGVIVTDLNVNITTAGFNVGGITLSGAASTFRRIRFDSCNIVTQNGVPLSVVGDCWGSSFENCSFTGEQTVVDTGSTVYDLDLSFRNCYFINGASDWYRTRVVRLKSTTPESGFIGVGGVILENCYFSDKWSTGHTDVSDPGDPPTGGGTAFPVMELEGVSGKNVVFQRIIMAHNVEDSPFVRMTRCRINGFTLNVSENGFLPCTYGSYSDGIIEVLDQSYITDLRYVNTLIGKVHRSVVYVSNSNDYTSTTDSAADLPAVIDGLHIAFDDASAWLSESLPYHHGLCLTQAGQSVVRRLVINADCKIATANAGAGISATTCLVRIRESYNTLDEFRIHNDTSNQGTVYDVIAVGGHNSDQSEHHNILNNGKLHIHWDTDLDPGTAQYPQFGISVSRLSGCLISGVTFYMEGDVPLGCAAIHSGTDLTRVTNCHVDVTGNCTTEDELLSFTSGAAACIAMGNVLRCRSGVTTPAISAAVGIDVGNLKLIQALPAQPSE